MLQAVILLPFWVMTPAGEADAAQLACMIGQVAAG
jgi:hypothetical protein